MDVVVGMIHDATMDSRFVRSLLFLRKQREKEVKSIIFCESGGGSLDRGRNLLVQKFLRTEEAPWLLMIDTDMYFDVKEFDALLEAGKEKGKNIISGLYYANERPPRPAAYRWNEEGHGEHVTDFEEGEVFEVDGFGAGFLLVHRKVYESMDHEEQYEGRAGSWFNQSAHGPAGQLLNEDSSFCVRAQAHGHKLYVASDAFVGHIKPRVLGWE